ncbi:hypothetical protein OAG1_13600 [Agarivorans sp. OAG1]|nr:hypothetical protein OAG1_13600 [Agarivorans sp. OAG1]
MIVFMNNLSSALSKISAVKNNKWGMERVLYALTMGVLLNSYYIAFK